MRECAVPEIQVICHLLTLQPTGFLAKTITLLTITLKWLYLTPQNLVTFCFYLLDTFWQNFSKIDSPRGVAAVVFERRCLEKLNIIYIQFFLFCFETMEMHTWGYKFVSGEMFSGIKSDFF